MRSLQNRLPLTQARRADDLLNEATELLEQHREVTNEEDYNMERALLTSLVDQQPFLLLPRLTDGDYQSEGFPNRFRKEEHNP